MNVIKKLTALAAVLALGACTTGMDTKPASATDVADNARSGQIWVGAIVANQNTAADRIALGLTADRYGVNLFNPGHTVV